MNKKYQIVQQYKPPESDVKFAFPPRTFQKSLLSSPSETSLALYSLEYCLLNLFSETERENVLSHKVIRKWPLTSWRKSNRTEIVLSEPETNLLSRRHVVVSFRIVRENSDGTPRLSETLRDMPFKSGIRFLVSKTLRFSTYHFLSLFVALTAICRVEVGDLQPCQACKIDFLLSATTNDVRDLRDDELWKEKGKG